MNFLQALPLAEPWDNWILRRGRIGDFDHTGRNQLLFIADKPYLFELRSRSLLGFW